MRVPRPSSFRTMTESEISEVLAVAAPARLATLVADGYPYITPLWYVFQDGAFIMTSVASRPHLRQLHRDRRAQVWVDLESGHTVEALLADRVRICDKGQASAAGWQLLELLAASGATFDYRGDFDWVASVSPTRCVTG